ncbi:hypothetical protein [Streptomyces sioyaensis]|uniref:hypothetical protein n=1 Tax=Streptomyces sioyaensis TaxID=67364 RepID=UPI00378E2571
MTIPDPEVLGTDFNATEPVLVTEWAIRYNLKRAGKSYITLFGQNQDKAFAAMETPTLLSGETRTLMCRDVRYTPWGAEGDPVCGESVQ